MKLDPTGFSTENQLLLPFSPELATHTSVQVLYVQGGTFIFSGEESFRESVGRRPDIVFEQTSGPLHEVVVRLKTERAAIGFQPIFTRDTRPSFHFVPFFFFSFFSSAISPVADNQPFHRGSRNEMDGRVARRWLGFDNDPLQFP